jgi:hypothetical protein
MTINPFAIYAIDLASKRLGTIDAPPTYASATLQGTAALSAVGEGIAPYSCPVDAFICDSFSDTGTMATHVGEIGATYSQPSGVSQQAPLTAAIVEDGLMYVPDRADLSNATSFIASGQPPVGADFYLEADVVVRSGFTGTPQFEFISEFDASGGNNSPFSLMYAQVLEGGTEWYVTAYNSPSSVSPTYAGSAQIPFAPDTTYTFRVEYRDLATDVRVYCDDVLLFSSAAMPEINVRDCGIAFYNTADLGARTADVLRFVGVALSGGSSLPPLPPDTLVEDTFSGTGTLSGHTTDSGHTWTALQGNLTVWALDGAGLVAPTGVGTPILRAQTSATLPTGEPLSFLATFNYTSGGGGNVGFFGIDSFDLFNGFDVQLDSGGFWVYVQRDGDIVLDEPIAFTLNSGEHTVRLDLNAARTQLTLYLDDIESGSYDLGTAIAAPTVSGVFMKGMAGFLTVDSFSIRGGT